jgi:hypothetical protein
LVYGDSQLIIDFANRKSKPGLAHLFLKVRRIQELCRKLKKEHKLTIGFRHVKRELNSVADWLGNVSRAVGSKVDATSLFE